MAASTTALRSHRILLPAQHESLGGIVGGSPAMRTVFSQVQRIAPHFTTALVTGETGTGKELVGRLLHDLSPSRKGNLVVLNCSAVVETLFESELFGHVRGAFTGATNDKIGLLEFAHGGTVFLDEIGDMPLATQAKLLRVLQNREIQRVGSLTTKKVDFRLVAATNKDLRKAVAERAFREDLYYRLSMVEVTLPPLRARGNDYQELMRHFLEDWSRRFGKPVLAVSDEVLEILGRHSWPGNVRELQNVVGHACMMASGNTIDLVDLPPYLAPTVARIDNQATFRLELPKELSPGVTDVFDEIELRLVRQALLDTSGNQIRAAHLLSTTRDRLRYRMKKYGLLQGARPGPLAVCA